MTRAPRRIAVAVTGALALVAIGAALYVDLRVTRRTERLLDSQVRTSAALVDELRATRTASLKAQATLVASLPEFMRTVATRDPGPIADAAALCRRQLDAALVLVTSGDGRVLADLGTPTAAILAQQPAVREACRGVPTTALVAGRHGLLQIVAVPVLPAQADGVATLTVGFLLDERLAAQAKRLTGDDIAFGTDGQMLASTLDAQYWPTLSDLLRTRGISLVTLGGDEYVVLPQPLPPAIDEAPAAGGPIALVLHARREPARFLRAVHIASALTSIVALVLAAIACVALSRASG